MILEQNKPKCPTCGSAHRNVPYQIPCTPSPATHGYSSLPCTDNWHSKLAMSAKDWLKERDKQALDAGYTRAQIRTQAWVAMLLEQWADTFTAEKDAQNQRQVRWIPVEERLPEERGFYLVCLSTIPTIVMESEYWDSIFHRMGGDFGEISNVTHWMPLPEPPAARAALESTTPQEKK